MALAVVFISRKSCKIYENVIKSPVFLPSFTKGTFPKMEIGRTGVFSGPPYFDTIVLDVLNQISCSLFYLWNLNMFNWGKDRCSQRRFHFHLQSFQHKHYTRAYGWGRPLTDQSSNTRFDMDWVKHSVEGGAGLQSSLWMCSNSRRAKEA